MKEYMALFAAMVMLISVAGCSDSNASSGADSGGTSDTSASVGSTDGTASGTTTSPVTTAAPKDDSYKGMEIISEGENAVEVTESDRESGGLFDSLFGEDSAADIAFDGAVEEYAYAEEEPSFAPTEAAGAISGGDYPAGEYIYIEPWTEEPPYIQPQAGLLTGGEWRDNFHWNDWVSLYQSHEEWENYRDTWRIEFDVRHEVIVTANGEPVEGAEVRIIYPDTNGIDTAVTDNNGKAYLFIEKTDEIGGIDVTYGNLSVTVDDVSLSKDTTHNIDFETAVEQAAPALDLMLMVDTTGSMSDELEYLKEELQNVVERVAEENGNLPIRVSVNFYRDEGDEYIVRYYPFTTDIDLAVNTIGEQEAMGGGDFPEAVHTALDVAVNQQEWSENATKLMFFVLDAPPHEDTQIIDQVNTLTAKAAAEGIRIIPVASSGIDKSTEYLLRTLAFTTGGTYTFLTDDSGIGGSHLQPTIGEYQVEKLNDMMVRIISDYLK